MVESEHAAGEATMEDGLSWEHLLQANTKADA
jgi:hypothetical protein